MESDFNLALSTLQRIDQGLRICNDGLFKADFGLWTRGLYHLFGELSTWMTGKEQTTFKTNFLEKCKGWQYRTIEHNLDQFLNATQYLRRIADKHKLIIKHAEDTSKHGGAL